MPELRSGSDPRNGLERRIKLERRVATLLMMLITVLMSWSRQETGIASVDRLVYDKVLQHTTWAKADERIAIIAIDDDSIDQLGHWPWRRNTHALLLQHLAQARAVGFGLLFNDPNPAYPLDDTLLEQAIARHGRVVLPTYISEASGAPDAVITPLPGLMAAAAGVGYINATTDEDGAIRSISLHKTLSTGEQADHLIVALKAVADGHSGAAPQKPLDDERLIPYVGSAERFALYPYAAVLRGDIPAEVFRDRLVLIGNWGTGIGHAFPTPVSKQGHLMPGVEIVASGLNALIHDRWISQLTPLQTALFSALPVLLTCVTLRRRSPWQSMVLALAVLMLVLLTCVILMHWLHLWFPPTASIIGIMLALGVWSWRSQEAALKHIDEQLKLLQRDISPSAHLHSPITILPDRSLPTRVTQLNQAISHIHRAERHREETLRFLSHDMRAPQSAILALLDMEAKNPGSMPPCVLMERVRQHALTTLKLADGFVHMAKAEMGALEHQDVDLADLLQECCDSFWEQSQQKGITFHCDSSVNDAWVVGDRDLLSRALRNLLDNALKYSPDGTTIRYSLERRGADWAISIQDQGCGLDSHQVDKLFRPFYRGNTTAPDGPDGVGLGLSFVQAVADRHGGTIAVHSEPGIGSIFTLTLRAAGNPKIRPDTRSQPS